MKKQREKFASQVLGFLAVVMTVCTILVMDALKCSTEGITECALLGGLLGGGLITNLVSGVLSPVTNLATGVLSTQGGGILASQIGSIAGGQNYTGTVSPVNPLVQGNVPQSGNTSNKLSWFQKFFNYWALGTPEYLVDQNGAEVFNFKTEKGTIMSDPNGTKVLNWGKIILHLSVVFVVGMLLYWMLKPKKKASGYRKKRF